MSDNDPKPVRAAALVDSRVDVSLIEETLRLSPTERLKQNDRMAGLAARLRVAFSLDPDVDDRGT
jgi:hypothetical protein